MYDYQTERMELFTDEGQRLFLKIRDHIRACLRQAGAVRMQEAISGNSGSSWTLLACVDRMVELEELRELQQERCPGQYRVFVARRLSLD